jgi:alkylation response protein AidB-like acyl-CoA dehydrogenase
MDFSLSPKHEELRSKARQVVEQYLLPRVPSDHFDREIVSELGHSGLLSLEYREMGSAIIAIELGRIDASIRGFVTVQTGLVARTIADVGTSEQAARWVPELCEGRAVGCYALTEPGAGSDARAISTHATRRGDSWSLSGDKHWITNGSVADIAIVFAQADEGLTAFLVPCDSPGFFREPMNDGLLGHRGSDHAYFKLRDCEARETLGEPGQGFAVAMSALHHGRLGVAAGAVGILQACLEASVDWARKRRQFGRRIGNFEMVQSDLADMAVSEAAARWLVMEAAWLADNGRDSAQAVAIAKLFATDSAQSATEKAVILHGARGYSAQYPVERHYRDVIGMRIYEGTSHIQRIIIARGLLGRELPTE